MHVGLATKATLPEFNLCKKCYDHFAVDINDLTSTPKVYTYTWAQLKPAGWGAPKAVLDSKDGGGHQLHGQGRDAVGFTIYDLKFTQ